MPEAEPVTLAAVWLLGVSLGLTACTITCLPFLGTWVFGYGGGRRETLAHVAAFLSGRIMGYSVLGAAAGGMGAALTAQLGAGMGHRIIGVVSLVAGLWLLSSAIKPMCSPVVSPSVEQPVRMHRRAPGRMPPFFLGAALTLVPCVPLATLLAVAAHGGSAVHGALLGGVFGFGAAATPLVLIAPVLGGLGRRLASRRMWLKRWLRLGAGAVLALLGVYRLIA